MRLQTRMISRDHPISTHSGAKLNFQNSETQNQLKYNWIESKQDFAKISTTFSQNFRGLIMISLVFPPTHSHSRSFTYLFRNDRRRRTKSSSWYLCVEKKKDRKNTVSREILKDIYSIILNQWDITILWDVRCSDGDELGNRRRRRRELRVWNRISSLKSIYIRIFLFVKWIWIV